MAKQVLVEEIQGCKTYLDWIFGKINHYSYSDWAPWDFPTVISRELCRLMLEIDFTWLDLDGVKDDEIRAKDALEVRKMYAEEIGQENGKNEREIDRIWKSIHGKTSVLELIFSLCKHLDEMLNEEESGEMIGLFYRILIGNLALDEFSDEDFAERKSEVEILCRSRIKTFLNREYFESGCCGGLFPLQNWSKSTGKDQRKVCLWYQMNAWLGEHLDDEGRFLVEKK